MMGREGPMAKILIVEDEDKLRHALERGLADEGYEVTAVEDGDLGVAFAADEPFDGLVLDLMLPGRDGVDVLRELRARGFPGPILILSARGGLEDRVLGLDLGADDYLTKPFAWSELLARLRACLRRKAAGEASLLHAGGVDLDRVRRRLIRGTAEVELTVRECELMEHLIRRAGNVVGRDELAREVWRDAEATRTNIIDVFVNYLRRKLEKVGAPGLIRTERGVGYVLEVGP